jgi:hypothetical protein
VHFTVFAAGFLGVSFEVETWFVGATFKPFVVSETVMDVLVP